jgi:hypothetical protein
VPLLVIHLRHLVRSPPMWWSLEFMTFDSRRWLQIRGRIVGHGYEVLMKRRASTPAGIGRYTPALL